MGLDLMLTARVRHRESGRIVSLAEQSSFCLEYIDEPDMNSIDICYWRKCYDVRNDLIEICAAHTGEPYTSSTEVCRLPQTALREVYVYLLSQSNLAPEEEPDAIYDRENYELVNLENALALRRLLFSLAHRVAPEILKEHITTPEEYEAYCRDPDAYEWEFEIWNSY